MFTFLSLVAGTFVSEDLTCIVAGVLIQQQQLDAAVGVTACALGIFVGDLAVYGVGRALGGRALQFERVKQYVTSSRRTRFNEWFQSNAAPVMVISRFLPGTRLPLYLVCGALRSSFDRFALWSLVAVLLWAPALVLGAATSGRVVGNPLIAGIMVVFAVRLAIAAATRRGRQRVVASISRVWRWEFWPMWLFYAPVVAWVAWLCLRYRGIGALAAANPGMPDGGIVGESKHQILRQLPSEFTIASALIGEGSHDARMWQLVSRMTSNGWSFPLVLKPDVGQRGTGVKIVRSLLEARTYLTREPRAVLVQPYHPGPREAGVFYYRVPGARHGRILSITDKHFPAIVGDGRSTLEELIWAHPRLRMQARTFLARHAEVKDRVLGAGESFRLGIAGNHAQGTLFRDGRHLITPALEDRIDSIARTYPGFFIGRFDIRYADVDRFKAGEDIAIVELNGATAESTNIYDPSGALIDAYRQLFRQWSLVFAIGDANRRRGVTPGTFRRLIDLLRAHVGSEVAFPVSD